MFPVRGSRSPGLRPGDPMLEWLTKHGYRVTLHANGTVFLQKGAWACDYGSLTAAFLGVDGPYTNPSIRIPKPKKKVA